MKSLVWISTIGVVLAGIFVALLPSHRDLDWQGDVIPMAQKYANTVRAAPGTKETDTPLEGIVAVVTGSTSGIGKSLTHALLQLGATVVAVGRSPSKLQALQDETTSKTLVTIQADFNDLKTIATAADQIVQQFPIIHILCNNAGAHDGFSNLWGTWESAQGYDQIFAVNYLSHVLLTEKLAGALHQSASPIIVQVSSSYHWGVDGSDLVPTTSNTKEGAGDPIASHVGGSHGFFFFRSQRSYANSKLAQILHARALKRKHPLLSAVQPTTGKKMARIVSVCPGWVRTQIVGGGILEQIVHLAAFHSDGWGLSSLFLALFDDSSSTTTGGADDADFYINSMFLSQVAFAYDYLPQWAYITGLRDISTFLMATCMLWMQRFEPKSITHPSSPESYNLETADALYDWSLAAIQPFL